MYSRLRVEPFAHLRLFPWFPLVSKPFNNRCGKYQMALLRSFIFGNLRLLAPSLAVCMAGVLACGQCWGGLDGNGEVDVVFSNAGQSNVVCLGNGTGGFLNCSDVNEETKDSVGVAVADLNNDGKIDVVFGNESQPNQVCLGNGTGGFLPCEDVNAENKLTTSVALTDLNDDGNIDAIFGNTGAFGERNQVCLGDGAGGFEACSNVTEARSVTLDVALADLNADGNTDAIFANWEQENEACLGDGNGGFNSCSNVNSETNFTWGVAIADLNGDGVPDSVFANEDQRNQVCLGDGSGKFTSCASLSGDSNKTTGVALADVNRDGVPDAVFANGGGFFPEEQKNRVCLGDGQGGLDSCRNVSEESSVSWNVGLEDFNGDGVMDAVFANNDQPNRLCLGNGAGGFVSCENVSGDSGGGPGLALALPLNSSPPLFRINAGHSGAWFNPDTSGQGQFIDVVPEDQFMFISWFTFTDAASDNPNEQQWYTAQGNYSGDTAVLDLFETLGGKFDDPQEVTSTQVGEVTLTFSDCEQGQMTYSFDEGGLQGEFPLIRVIGGSGNICEQLSGNTTQAVDINAGMDGAWFDPDTSGQGYFIDAHPDPEGGNFIFVSWFTYGNATASGQRWLTAQDGFEGSMAEIDVFETTGGSFDDPEPVSTTMVGTMIIDFTDCSNALLSYSLPADPAEGDIAITRVIPGSQALCEELTGAD